MSKPRTGPAPATKNQLTVIWLLLLIAVAGIAVVVLGRLFGLGDVPPGPAVEEESILGRTFPDWQFDPLYAAEAPVSSESLKGKVVLLSFWATWCPPCRKELPQIAELGKEFAANEDFRLVTVSCGQTDFDSAKQESLRLLESRDLDVPTFFDPNATVLRAWQDWTGDNSIPVTFVLDREGKIRQFWVGGDPQYIGQMRQKIQETLAQ